MISRHRNSRRRSTRVNRDHLVYQSLEPRQMLTVDIGLTVTTSTFDNMTNFFAPDISADVGPNHIVQVLNGEYSIRNRNGGAIEVVTPEFFWLAAGADLTVDFDVSNNPILGKVQDARVVFDHDSGRWFVSSILADQNGNDLLGNPILLAVSRTSNPIDGFQSVQFIGDPTILRVNRFATLGVNAEGLFIATNNFAFPANNTVSLYAIPKADLLGLTPDISNLQRFENMNQAMFGRTIQFATDLNADSSRSLGLGNFASGNQLSVFEITDLQTGAASLTHSMVTVPFYQAAPGGRQPNAIAPLNNISPDFTASVVSQNGYLWAVHTVLGSSANSAIRWYQIDETTLDVVNTGDIQNPNLDFLYPSISVNEFGVIAIGFTATGLAFAPSSMLTMGYTTRGLDAVPTITFPQPPALLQQGLDNFVNLQGGINPWGEYTATRFDPTNPFSFFTFQEFVPMNNTWGVTLGRARLDDIAPVIRANDLDNEVVIRRSVLNSAWLEIMIDGNVTDVFEMSSLDTLHFDLMGGNDTFTIDHSLGLVTTQFGFSVDGGAGTDTVAVIDVNGHRFDITGDGSGVFDLVNTFTGFEILIGSAGSDIFTATNSASDWELIGMAGDDLFDISNSATGMLILRGMDGNDTYRVPIANFATIEVIDSIAAENDTLIGLGTEFDDEILVNNNFVTFNGMDVSNFGYAGIESIGFDGLAGNDIFQIQAVNQAVQFFGSSGDDVFNVSSNAPINTGVLTGIQGELFIDGGSGNNRLVVSNRLGSPVTATVTADQILGFTTNPINYSGNFGNFAGMPGIQLLGSDLGDDTFEIVSLLATNTLLVRGGFGNDTFTVRSGTLGEVVLDGNEGADIYRTSFGLSSRRVIVNDTGMDSSRDRFSIRATDFPEQFDVSNNRIAFLEEEFLWNGVESLVLDTRGGDDVIGVRNNDTPFIRVILGAGNDTATVFSTIGIQALRLDGDDGNDFFQIIGSVAATFVQARGGEGNDRFEVGGSVFGRVKVDGEQGNDEVSVTFASRDSRRVNARDSGGGNDTLTVLGTPTADRIKLRPRVIDREGEFIVYDENTEDLFINLLGSNDVIDVFGTSADRVFANLGVGNDTVNVHSTSTTKSSVLLSFSLGPGADTGNVFRVSENARVELFGQSGDDTFNVGSTPTSDNGNLNRIRGELFVGGGPGQDTLHINDRGAGTAGFNYLITDRRISHDPGTGGTVRAFQSFNYADMSFISVSGTDGRNVFTVTPSLTSSIRVFGNDHPSPAAIFGDRLNVLVPLGGATVFGTPENGFAVFDAGFRNISFRELQFVNILPTI